LVQTGARVKGWTVVSIAEAVVVAHHPGMDENAPSPIAERLRQLRAKTGETRREVSDSTGLTEKTVNRAESEGAMSTTTLLALAEHYGVQTDYILCRTDDVGAPGRQSAIESIDDASRALVDQVLATLGQDAQTTTWLREQLETHQWHGVSEGTLRSYVMDLLLKRTGRFVLPAQPVTPNVRPGGTRREPRRGRR
jgi:transcriptional regulator with XRE-family HTH domain